MGKRRQSQINEMIKLILSLSLSGSILILILFLCKPLFQSKMSRAWQYYIWLAVIARLLLPFAPQYNLVGSLFKNYDYAASQLERKMLPESGFASLQGTDLFPNTFTEDSKAEDEGYTPVKVMKYGLLMVIRNLGLVWMVVALILLIRKITIYQSFIKYVKAGCTPVDDINHLEQFGKEAEDAKINVSVELYTNILISSPLLLGFFHPCIVLPGTDCSDLDFQYTIRHELTHFKRKDMFYKWLMQTVVCLHWFNPLVYLMARDVNRLCELSCDEAIIRHLNENAMRDYGNTLLGAVRPKGNYKNSLASVTLNESRELLKERLDAIMNYKKQSNMIKVLSFIMTLTICLGGAFTGAYAAAPNPLPEKASGQDTAETEEEVVFHLASNGHNAITKSDSFVAEDDQILTITIQSDIKGGSVDLFLFSPDNKEQRITINDSDETKTITLSAGRWAYNCTGFFQSGSITIRGTVPRSHDNGDSPHKTEAEVENNKGTVINLSNGKRDSITHSGSFDAKDDQVLTLTIQSDIKGGSADIILFSPNHEEQRITVTDSDVTKTIELSAGRWAYNCTGFFESGDITITGKIE